MLVEVVGGLLTGSLALLSDAAHMGTDVLGLGMSLAAVHLASRPSPPQRTYGAYRLEVLAALANGVLLFAVAGYILYEAYRRFADPPEVLGVPRWWWRWSDSPSTSSASASWPLARARASTSKAPTWRSCPISWAPSA